MDENLVCTPYYLTVEQGPKSMDIEWKAQYEVGNFEIDAEHKIFVKIVAKIQHAFLQEKDMAYIDRLFLELFRYAEFHFCSEENIMMDAGYPGLSQHQEEHKQLLFSLRDRLPTPGGKKHDMSGIIDFLMQWFACHTTTTDLKVAQYLRSCPPSPDLSRQEKEAVSS